MNDSFEDTLTPEEKEVYRKYGRVRFESRLPIKAGTEWTEPGQGATVREINKAAIGRGAKLELAAGSLADRTPKMTYRTNLRLTGEPLTAEDLERIAKCK